MENKCNKTPNTNNKYMEHVYCHQNESKSYIRANNNAGGGGGATSATNADYLALLKENKQLRAMLILHLDLIQAQSDQLQVKDKQLATQSEELDGLRSKNQQLETQVLELQKQLQRHIKRTANSPPPLAKIQRQTDPILPNTVTAGATAAATTSGTKNIIGECNGKLISKIILHRVSLPEHSPTNSTTTGTSDSTSEADDSSVGKAQLEHDENEDEEHCEEEEEEEDADMEEAGETTGNTTEDSNDIIAVHTKPLTHQRMSPVLTVRGAKPLRQITMSVSNKLTAPTQPVSTTLPSAPSLNPTVTTNATSLQVCVTPTTPSRGKQMPLMLWHAPDLQSDESGSCESIGSDQRSLLASPVSPKVENKTHKPKNNTTPSLSLRSRANLQSQQRQNKPRRCAYISTGQMYCTRAWEDEEIIADGYEFMKEEAEALKADAPMLEIPKWTEHELTVSYCIEGTENLADESFHKRHEKLELAEKRRKKWDVQQIREQRRIEKLKRRHCKDEIQVPPDQQPLLSFYPQPDTIQTICFTSDLPVQAFGELVPKLGAHNEFDLPWLEALTTVRTEGSAAYGSVITLAQSQSGINNTTLAQGQQQLMNSTFVFVKKRKRQQSGAAGSGTTGRQRSALRKAAAAAAAAITATSSIANVASVVPEAAAAAVTTTTTMQPLTTMETSSLVTSSAAPPILACVGVAEETTPK